MDNTYKTTHNTHAKNTVECNTKNNNTPIVTKTQAKYKFKSQPLNNTLYSNFNKYIRDNYMFDIDMK